MRTKILSFFAIPLVAFTLLSCQSKEERAISKLDQLAERIEKNAETFDDEEWDSVFNEYDQLHEELAKCDFSQEQYKELGRVEGRLAATMTKERAKKYGRDFGNILKSGKNFVDGFVEGLTKE